MYYGLQAMYVLSVDPADGPRAVLWQLSGTESFRDEDDDDDDVVVAGSGQSVDVSSSRSSRGDGGAGDERHC